MEKVLGKEVEAGPKRMAYLSDNCDKVEEKGYMKRFNEDEVSEMKDILSDVAIEINDLEEEKKLFMAEFKERIKPFREEKKRLLVGLKNRAEFVRENCYKFVDTETRQVAYYNAEGDLVDYRSANADELQGNIFQITRKVN